MTASRRSCTPASIATGVAPSAASRRCRSRRRAGSVSASGVRYQVAPSNSSARAFCAPRVSMPAIGWPPMKRGRSAGWHRRDDAGLGRADVGDRGLGRELGELGQHGGKLGHGRAQRHELGARDTAAARSPATSSTQPRVSAASRAPGSGSKPTTRPTPARSRAASPSDPPISPSPTIARRWITRVARRRASTRPGERPGRATGGRSGADRRATCSASRAAPRAPPRHRPGTR